MNKTLITLATLVATTLQPARMNAAPTASAPATISKEADLVVVTLTAEAEQHLRLKVVPVEKRAVPAARLFAGEVVFPLGAKGGSLAPVVSGDLNQLLLLADQQAAAEGRILQAQVRVDVAKIAFERAKVILEAEAGSVRVVDESRAALGSAEADLSVAKAQRALLGEAIGPNATPRRTWIRVPVYSGESARLDTKADVSVTPIGSDAKRIPAKPVTGPPTANGLANTIDWYYELPTATALRPGLRVSVEIPITDSSAESLVVPFAAVLHDIHGGQWVYEQTSEHHYTRRRVSVKRLSGGDAVLASGPAPGSKIVTDGATELFGTEFMTGK